MKEGGDKKVAMAFKEGGPDKKGMAGQMDAVKSVKP